MAEKSKILPLMLIAMIGFGLASYGRFILNQNQASAVPVTVAATWSATAVEKATWSGLQADWGRLDADLAPIVTRADLRAEVIRYVSARAARISKTEEEFLAAVRVGHCPPATPLKYDGVSWIASKETP